MNPEIIQEQCQVCKRMVGRAALREFKQEQPGGNIKEILICIDCICNKDPYCEY